MRIPFDAKEGFLEEFLTRYYADNRPPEEVILPEAVDDGIGEYLSHLRGGRVRMVVPQRGEKKKLLDLVHKNVEIAFFGDRIKVEDLKRRLHLPALPVVIECFDVSHLSGTAMVGSMVQFRWGGQRGITGASRCDGRRIDDPAAIAEVVRRRYSGCRGGGDLRPVIVDGGRQARGSGRCSRPGAPDGSRP